jgi:hypothetical protein
VVRFGPTAAPAYGAMTFVGGPRCLGVGGKKDGCGEADEGERGENDHCDHGGPDARGEIGDEDGAGDRGSERGAEVDTARDTLEISPCCSSGKLD